MTTLPRSRLHAAFTAGVCLFAALLALRPLDEDDTFYHLTLGRAVLHYGARTLPEPTAFVDFSDAAVAAEWLWGVVTYTLYRIAGASALCVMAALLAALAAHATLRLIRGYWPSAAPFPWLVWVSTLVFCTLQSRVAIRPELPLLAGLPYYVLATRAYAQAAMPRRLQLGIALALAVVVWAQCHGSFVLAPAIFVIQVARWPSSTARAELRVDAAVLALLLAALLSSAYGVQISHFIGSHAAGDATHFVAEMSRTSWGSLEPLGAPSSLAYWLLMLGGIAGMFAARQWFARELLLLGLGLALLCTANRFLAEAALLAGPWAARSTGALALHLQAAWTQRQARSVQGVLLVSTAGLLAWAALFAQELRGPLLRTGVLSSAFPIYAPRVLRQLPEGSAVLTDYASSATVGFLAHGKLRTFIDGRTPLYFDDTDFAIQREMMRDALALRNGLQRYRARAAVVRRDSEACLQLSKVWSVAMVEPLFTTFVETPPQQGPTALRACGVRYLTPDMCADPMLGSSIAFVRKQGAEEFASFLDAERGVRCGGNAAAALRAIERLEPLSRPYHVAFRRTQVEALLQVGRFEAAARLMMDAVQSDDPAIINLLQGPSAGQLPLELARRILTSYLDVARDEADPATRATLAEICARAADLDCARFNAMRAAVRGRRSGALEWLEQHHPAARIRHDAQRWLEVLNGQNSQSPTR
jgi:hypothetical protein